MAELLGQAYGSLALDIAAIKQARYGREVRAAIAEALELINGGIPAHTDWEAVSVNDTVVSNSGCQYCIRGGVGFINGYMSFKQAITKDFAFAWVPESVAPKHQCYCPCLVFTGGIGSYTNARMIGCWLSTNGKLVTTEAISKDEWVAVTVTYPVQ